MSNIIQQNQLLYWIQAWSEGYFTINDLGHVSVKPDRNSPNGDLFELVQELVQRGIEPPILIRFNDILRQRIKDLYQAFQAAIQTFNYRNSYQMAFPIKVNPQKHVIEVIQEAGAPYSMGLEVGSKPELLAVLPLHQHLEALLLCNGYKDAEYIELALLASRLGRRTIIIVEQFYELKLILETADRLGIEADIGVRIKPSSKGTGRWTSSGGDFAKFGLNATEIMACVDHLTKAGKIHWLKLLHMHIGSQITSIDAIQKALNEAARLYVELAKICPELAYFDAGGGLAVDYEGSKTTDNSSMNYTLEEYARNVVSAIGEACLKAGLPDPVLITESGRALVAHHSVLIIEVIDVSPALDPSADFTSHPPSHELLKTLYQLYQDVASHNYLETLHDALELKDQMLDQFIHGTFSLSDRAYGERLYRHLIAKVRTLSYDLPYVPQEVERLDQLLRDTYFCNFSLFQSLPDSWAIDQIFPIMPIHRLDEAADRKGILADLSCDSDGKIDHFFSCDGKSSYLDLHPFNGSPYYLGVFLVGAYQEILGGLHNLFGDANAVHVSLGMDGKWNLHSVVEGDTMEEVLSYVQYQPIQLIEQLRALIEKSLKAERISPAESAKLQKKFREYLESYTYLIV